MSKLAEATFSTEEEDAAQGGGWIWVLTVRVIERAVPVSLAL